MYPRTKANLEAAMEACPWHGTIELIGVSESERSLLDRDFHLIRRDGAVSVYERMRAAQSLSQ